MEDQLSYTNITSDVTGKKSNFLEKGTSSLPEAQMDIPSFLAGLSKEYTVQPLGSILHKGSIAESWTNEFLPTSILYESSSIPAEICLGSSQIILSEAASIEPLSDSIYCQNLGRAWIPTTAQKSSKTLTQDEIFQQAFESLEESENKWRTSLKLDAKLLSWRKFDEHDISENSRK